MLPDDTHYTIFMFTIFCRFPKGLYTKFVHSCFRYRIFLVLNYISVEMLISSASSHPSRSLFLLEFLAEESTYTLERFADDKFHANGSELTKARWPREESSTLKELWLEVSAQLHYFGGRK